MLLRRHAPSKDGKDHTDWSLVETVRTPDGPRQRTLCYLGELNNSARARWLKTIEVFNEQGESHPLKLFPSDVEPPEDDATVAQVRLDKVRLERSRRFGDCFLGLELWKRLEMDRFWASLLDRPDDPADVAWSRSAALLAINRLCAPGTNWRLKSVGIPRRRLTTYGESAKARSTTRVCTDAWTVCCRTKQNWSGISPRVRASCSEPSSRGSFTIGPAAMWRARRRKTR